MEPHSDPEEAPSSHETPDLFSSPTEDSLPESFETAPEPSSTASEPSAEESAPGEDSAPTATAENALSSPLEALSDRALTARLSPAEEEQAAALLKTALLEGRKGVEHAVIQLPKLPWIIGVNGVSAAWPEMKTLYRARLIGGLAKNETDAARRVRLSLARGLFKQDILASVKLAVGVSKEIRDKETGSVTPKNAQIFANVLIGRAKPWIAQVPLADLKPADADLLVHCAVTVVFGLPHAPTTQLGILKWSGDRLAKLPPAALEAVTRGVGRWNAKWQSALRKDLPNLPEEIAGVLRPVPAAAESPRRDHRRPIEKAEAKPVEAEDKDENAPIADEPVPEADAEESDREPEDEEDEDRAELESAPPTPPPPRQRPVYESKTMPAQPARRGHVPQNFNLSDALKQIESYCASLRSELQIAQNKLRLQQRDDERKPRRSVEAPVPGEPTMEELARLNRQLESRIAEQQERIEELLKDSEDRAASMSIPEAAASPDAQLRTLLALKLQEDFEDFSALESEAPDIVVQQHYRSVLRHVFEVLRAEGIRLSPPPPSSPSSSSA